MPAFLHFWRGMTPSDYWALTYAEYAAMTAYANKVIEDRAGEG